MKTIKHTFLAALMGVFLMSNSTIAQEEKEYFITVTTLHWNMDQEDFSLDAWKALEKEYLEKVVKKNEFIIGQEFLMHYFTADNTELLLVSTFESWDAIEKASVRTDELEKLAWPDEKARTAYFDKKGTYYGHNHSDEIYSSYAGAKMPKGKMDKEMLFYVRKSHLAYPKGGNEKEFKELHNQYLTAVTYKNDFVKAYYPNVHAWGANKTEFTEVFVLDSLSDIEKYFDKNEELAKAWKDEGKRKEFGKKIGRYFTGEHGDYLYKLVPELTK
ncbi:hypothetical protein [Flavobacterium sp. GT3R68]|uniref:hypothetical protein n=1 Tax=Flavobacterium sp. GT3R68 TaxID=2594437 RepID=UPI000F86BD8B|nr:hypothetical protein [Flavobacterium sp. GT3R68]RTY86466.1 hypothetical protein EKL32_27570 [Flavobacterium sp. GSN2]TRW94036.1 hypothetical protein FNW07_03740 [Flavobacterium sp. GT3R68]